MNTIEFYYEDQLVEFEPTSKENLMVNATQMAKIFGKEVARFMENDSTKKFINACMENAKKTRNSSFFGIQNINT